MEYAFGYWHGTKAFSPQSLHGPDNSKRESNLAAVGWKTHPQKYATRNHRLLLSEAAAAGSRRGRFHQEVPTAVTRSGHIGWVTQNRQEVPVFSREIEEEGMLKDLEARKRLLALEERMQQRDREIEVLRTELSRQLWVQESSSEPLLGRVARLESEVSALEAIELRFGHDVSEHFAEPMERGCVKKLICFWVLQLFQMVFLKRNPVLSCGGFRLMCYSYRDR
jgi:hypothetical protein